MLKWSHYKDISSKIQLFSLSHCFVWLLAGAGAGGGGGKLSRAVYLAPINLGIKVKLYC